MRRLISFLMISSLLTACTDDGDCEHVADCTVGELHVCHAAEDEIDGYVHDLYPDEEPGEGYFIWFAPDDFDLALHSCDTVIEPLRR